MVDVSRPDTERFKERPSQKYVYESAHASGSEKGVRIIVCREIWSLPTSNGEKA